MLRRIVQACFLLFGGTLGTFLIPELLKLTTLDGIVLINNPYVSALIGAILFYLIIFWAVDYIVDLVKWMEDRLVKVPITDLLFGSLGLTFGLIVAFLAGLAINQMEIRFVNTFVPIVLTLLLGYLGFR